MKAVDLIRLSIEIENGIDANGDLTPIPGKDSALLVVSRHRDGHLIHFRYDIPTQIRRQVLSLGPDAMLTDHEQVKKTLRQYETCEKVWAGEGCYFTRVPRPEEYADVVKQGAAYVVLVEGEAVSRAWTQDESARAAELAVETRGEYRRYGYARQVVSAWAAGVIEEGKVAFYSYLVGNEASAGLARSLGVEWYARSTGYS